MNARGCAAGCAAVLAWICSLPPAIARDANTRAIKARDLAVLRDLDGLSISPDGAWAAFQVRRADPSANRYDMSWHVTSTRAPLRERRLSGAGDPMLLAIQGRVNGFIMSSPPAWSPDSSWIAYLRKDGGRTQAWHASRDGRVDQITFGEADVRALAYAKDGLRIFFKTEGESALSSAALAREGQSGFLYDSRFFPVYDRRPVAPADVSMQGEQALLHSPAQRGAWQTWVYDIEERHERPATAAEQGEFEALVVSPKPVGRPALRGQTAVSADGALAWTEARDPEQQGGLPPLTLVMQPTGADSPVVCRAAECTGQSIKGIWWRNEDEVVFARGEGSLGQVTAFYAWRADRAGVRFILRTPARLTSNAEVEWRCGIALDRLVCFYETADYPRRLAAVDLDDGSIEILHDPNPDFRNFALGEEPRRLEIRAPSGVRTHGVLVLPARHRPGERLPLVVVTYRCAGFLRGGVGDETPVYPLAAQGFAVLCFNIPTEDHERLARESHAPYQNWARGPGDPMKHRIQESLDAAVRMLDEVAVIDPQRVGLAGLSYGAETVSFALFNMRHLTTAIASTPEIGPASAFLYSRDGRDRLRRWGFGAEDTARWQKVSLSLNAHRVRAPFLLNVADHETISALQSVAALEDAGRAVEMHVFPDEYHIKWQPAHRLAIYERNIDWMNFWLRGVEDSDPTRVEQYKRWRAMRVKQCELFKGDHAPWYCRQ